MISVSCVVTAPYGMAACLLPSDFVAQADGVSFEIIVADGAQEYTDQSRPGLRHLWLRGASVYGLMTLGLVNARMDWVLIIEDHGRPMPGLLQVYRDAIENYPEIDLFGGSLENMTSTSSWSFATFLFGSHEFWPPARQLPARPSNANLMVRREALRDSELVVESGFMFHTVRRLVSEKRYMYRRGAVVDHVAAVTFRESLLWQFACSARVTAGQRAALPSKPLLLGSRNPAMTFLLAIPRPAPDQLAIQCRRFVNFVKQSACLSPHTHRKQLEEKIQRTFPDNRRAAAWRVRYQPNRYARIRWHLVTGAHETRQRTQGRNCRRWIARHRDADRASRQGSAL